MDPERYRIQSDLRGLLEGDLGRIGLKLDGKGPLRNGFAGQVAAITPELWLPQCAGEQASLYGRISVRNEKPRFTGPLRLANLTCLNQGISLEATGLQVDATFDEALDGVEAHAGLRTGKGYLNADHFAGTTGTAQLTFRKRALTEDRQTA